MTKTASEVLKAFRYLAGFLGAATFVEHVGRMTNGMASLADELSRRPMTKCQLSRTALEKAVFRPVDGYLIDWLSDPCSGGNLFGKLLQEKKL